MAVFEPADQIQVKLEDGLLAVLNVTKVDEQRGLILMQLVEVKKGELKMWPKDEPSGTEP